MSCRANNAEQLPLPVPDLLERMVKAVGKATDSILPNMGFKKPRMGPGHPMEAKALMGASITLAGHPPAHIALLLDEPAAVWVARTALWLEDHEELGADDVSAAVSELLNMITGQIQYELSRAGHKGAIGLPEFFESDVPLPYPNNRMVVASFGDHSFFVLLSHEV